MKKTSYTLIGTFAIMGLLVGCGMDQEVSTADQANETTEITQMESALVASNLDHFAAGMSAEDMAAQAVANAEAGFNPSACYSAETIGPKVIHTFDDCTGPFGLVHVTGVIEVVFKIIPGGMGADLTGSLQINYASLELDASAELVGNAAGGQLAVSTRSTSVGRLGFGVVHTGEYSLAFNSETQCIALDGEWSTRIGAAIWSTSLSDFQKCAAGCPAAGGHLEWHGGISDVTVIVDYDGSNVATWENSRGRSGTLNLPCTP